MIILVKLFLAHLMGDFLFQPHSWVIDKEKKKLKSPKLYLHTLIHGVALFLLLWDWKLWTIALPLMLSHFAIDTVKLYFSRQETKTAWFLADQGLHIISIIAIWYLVTKPETEGVNIKENVNLWIYITSAFFITLPASIIIKVALRGWSLKLMEGNDASLADAGKYIGILERLFVFLFVVTGHWEAVGFLLAAKSVFRFGDLKESKDRKLTEYILIGTLISFGIAISTGLLVLRYINGY